MILNRFGKIVENCWLETEKLRSNIFLDAYIVMPNHFHGILGIDENCQGTARCAPTDIKFGVITSNSLPSIVRGFKSAVTKQINLIRNTPCKRVWQRNYYEHVIRNEKSLTKIREYIIYNALGWEYEKKDYCNMV